ncbi:DoxX family protein [Amycolatopsis acidicola]|uniref:DoxX family protein n=1 Tax=Amycolatopsis acidicola TaxID=2596893 RepID=A0A5N0V031_9PSEU|nr:DoxX family protein [Amycolatopsis acidicola]KAA9158906.1 DoxX family protein [Amycolatopsis acidicola]
MYGRVQDVAALIGRVGVGVVFLAHGLDKWNMGVSGVSHMTEGLGIPLPTLTAIFLIVVETIGAVAFMVGFALPVLAVAYAVDMIGAIFFVHIDKGLTGQGGYEEVLLLAAAAIALGFNGGRLSLDHFLFWRPRAKKRELATA